MTSKQDIQEWFERGVNKNATHMIVVCDTFSYEDYPIFAKDDEDALRIYRSHDDVNMQTVMEVYDLSLSMEEQLQPNRVFNLPKITDDNVYNINKE